MTDDLGPYSRVYWGIRGDRRFVGIYTDNNHLATWLRLLIAADAVWPAPADLPRSARQASVSALEAAGLVELLPGDLFRIHGLDAERERRASAGRAGASARWKRPDSERNAIALPPHSGTNASRDEPRRAEPSIAPAREGLPNLNSAVAKCWEDATGRSVLGSGAYAADYVDDACRRHPPSEVAAAILRARKTFDHIPDAAQLVSAMRPLLDPLPDRKQVQDAAGAERRTVANRAQLLKSRHNAGHHVDAPDADCPTCQRGNAA